MFLIAVQHCFRVDEGNDRNQFDNLMGIRVPNEIMLFEKSCVAKQRAIDKFIKSSKKRKDSKHLESV